MSVWLLKPAELALKGDNRKSFEDALLRNLKALLPPAEGKTKITKTNGRFYVRRPDEETEAVENVLSRLPGISGWAKTSSCEKTPEAVLRACVEEGKKLLALGVTTFKIDARRTDKAFPLDSYEICRQAGDAVVRGAEGLKVNVRKPEEIITVEIREKAYIYSCAKKGLGGLPARTAGKGLLLLSGGIDSPVAGFLMAVRGMGVDAIHFHAYPYTSEESRQKVKKLAEIIGAYCMGVRLHIINFAPVQLRIKERAPAPWATVLLRMAMMEAAEASALKSKCKCLITGESLSQVASQTIENINCAQSRIKLPVLRPLIGLCKDAIIRESERIGAYPVSIQPYEDCCSLFSPPHPILRGNAAEAASLYEKLELEPLIEKSLQEREISKRGL